VYFVKLKTQIILNISVCGRKYYGIGKENEIPRTV